MIHFSAEVVMLAFRCVWNRETLLFWVDFFYVHLQLSLWNRLQYFLSGHFLSFLHLLFAFLLIVKAKPEQNIDKAVISDLALSILSRPGGEHHPLMNTTHRNTLKRLHFLSWSNILILPYNRVLTTELRHQFCMCRCALVCMEILTSGHKIVLV